MKACAILVKVLLLLLPPALAWVAVEHYLDSTTPISYKFEQHRLRNLGQHLEVVITGSSHEAEGILPERLREPALNLANSSQSLYYDTNLMQRCENQLPHLRLLIMGVTWFTFRSRVRTDGEPWRSHFYYKYWGIPTDDGRPAWVDARNFSLLALLGPDAAPKALIKTILHKAVDAPLPDDPAAPSEQEVRDRVRGHEDTVAPNEWYLPENLKMVRALLSRMRDRHVRVVFVDSPVYQRYAELSDRPLEREMVSLLRGLQREFPISCVNYFRDNRFTAGDFRDPDHLNLRGAVKYTRLVDDEVIAKYLKN